MPGTVLPFMGIFGEKKVLFLDRKRSLMAGQFRAEFMFQLGGSEV